MTSGRRERRRRGRGAANFHEKSTVPRAYIPIRFYINSWARVAALKASAKINIGSILDGLLIKPDTVIAVCSRPSLLLFSSSPLPPFNSTTCARRTRIILSTGTRDVSLFKIEIYVRPLDGTRWNGQRGRLKWNLREKWCRLTGWMRNEKRGYLKHLYTLGVDESSEIRIGVDLGKKSNAWTSAREVDRETPAKRGSSIHVMSRCPASRTS